MVSGYKKTEIGFIPENWDVRPLGEISTPKARIGWQNLRKDEYLDSGIYMLITGTDFSNGRVDYSTCKYVSKERYYQDANIQVRNGDILITKDGTLGKVAMVTKLNMPATLNAGVFVLNNLSPVINNRFLYHYLNTNRLMKFAERTSTGGTIQHLNQGVLVNFPVPIPPVDEQLKIADALTDIDDLIVEEGKLVAKYQDMKEGCLQHMFPRKGQTEPDMRLPGFSGAWEQHKLDDLCELITKQTGFDYSATIKPSLLTKKGDNTYSFIQNKDFNGNEINLDTDFYIPVEVAEKFPKILIDKPSLLISISGRIGNVGFYKLKQKAFIGGAVGICKLKNSDDGEFLTQELESEYGQKYFQSLIKASSHANITVEDIRNIELILPPTKEERNQISDFLLSVDNLITLHQHECEKYQMIKQGMMEDLLTGKIRLK